MKEVTMPRKQTITEKYTETRTTKHTFDVYFYPKVVLVVATTKDSGSRKPSTETILFSREIYKKYQGQKSWRWVSSLKPSEELVIVTRKYMDHYKAGNAWQWSPRTDGEQCISETRWKKVLDSGDFRRVVLDRLGYDAMFYGIDGKPVLRAFHYDYISAGLYSGLYLVADLFEWIKKQKGVSNAKMVDVPYYNSDSGSRAIEFDFTPTPQFFKQMMDAKDTFERDKLISAKLKVEKFQSPDYHYVG